MNGKTIVPELVQQKENAMVASMTEMLYLIEEIGTGVQEVKTLNAQHQLQPEMVIRGISKFI